MSYKRRLGKVERVERGGAHQNKTPIILLVIVTSMLFMVGLLGILSPSAVAAEAVVAETAVPSAVFPVIADFEGGVPADWFAYEGGGAAPPITTVPTIGDTDPLALPGQVGDNDILSVTANAATGWSGFGAALNPVQDWSDYDALTLWFYGENSGTTHEIEVQTVADDDRKASFVDSFSGWRQIILPFTTFGAGGAYDVSQVDNWVFVLDGTVGSFHMDNLELVNLNAIADFEGGVPADWFVYQGGGAAPPTIDVATIGDTDGLAIPGQVGDNDILSVAATVPDGAWAGFGVNLIPAQNWSDMQGVSFWFYGANSGTTHEFEIQTATDGNRRAEFVEDFTGWQLITLPFATLTPSLDVSQVTAWVFVLDGTDGSFYLDDISLYSDAGNITVRTQFEANTYNVEEGLSATLTVTLNTTSVDPVTVDFATSDGTAIDGIDYTATSGTLEFAPGSDTQTVTVDTLGNDEHDGDKDLTVTLSNPTNAEIGPVSVATVIIEDNDEADPATAKIDLVDDFESGLPSGVDGDGNEIGFVTWGDDWNGTTVAIATNLVADTDPLALPNQSGDNNLYQVDLNVAGWGGTTHAFENEAVDTWTPQDWSGYEGISFWLYGNNTGNTLLFEIQDNRNPGSTGDDTEIWSYTFTDDFAGWQYFELGFDQFSRKEIGNGAPNDGFGREEVHAWAFGSLATGGADVTYYMDNVGLIIRTQIVDDFESGLIPSGVDGDGNEIGYVVWGDDWNGTTTAVSVTTVGDADPLALPGQSGDNILYQFDANVVGWGGTTHAFENEAVDTWTPQDWSTFEGICFWLYGSNNGNTLLFEIQDNRNPGSTGNDTEIWSHTFTDDFSGWKFFALDFEADFERKEIGNGAPNDGFGRDEVHAWAFGSLATGGADVTYYLDNVTIYGNTGSDQPLEVEFDEANYNANEGETAVLTVTLSRPPTEIVTVDYATAESTARVDRQYTPDSGTLTFDPGVTEQTIEIDTYADGKHTRDRRVAVNLYEGSAPLGFQHRAVLTIVDLDPVDPKLVDDFEGFHPFINSEGDVDLSITTILDSDPAPVPGQPPYEDVLNVAYDTTAGPASFDRVFSQAQDWSVHDGLKFLFYGSNSGEIFTMELKDNMAATTSMVDPSEWVMVWSDEFNDPAGTPPNPNVWQHELGDGALNEIVGWGNSESQFYTNDPANAATDGAGNLVIRLDEVDTNTTDLVCWYGPCEYTSARLITQDQLDFEYGRIEARVLVPDGPAGLWPAFWMLGENIPEVGWPQSGEIDIMEYVSKNPNEVFGTIHGPGYSGGAGFGNIHTFAGPVAVEYHTFAVEWNLDEINWYVDDIHYHQADPADVASNEWVFNHPFFVILNTAIGGNFGGPIDDTMTFPQDTLVDYVRVYQAADSAERFEATFVDNFSGWQEMEIAFDDFTRSTEQPPNAPDDGLGLNKVWGYGFKLPMDAGNHASTATGAFMLDRVRLAEDTTAISLSNVDGGLTTTAIQQWLLPLILVLLIIILFVGLYYRSKQRA